MGRLWRAPGKTLCALLVAGMLFGLTGSASSAACAPWRDWENYRSRFISNDGRVIDHGTEADITTSEGQAYSMMFALVANDRPAFDLLLKWTSNNLAKGNLNDSLPAWKWGKRTDNSWGVIDQNSSADADVWLTYALAEAGRLWKHPAYSAVARSLANRIVAEESIVLDDLGRTLLPGRDGFKMPNATVRLNPSYYPVQVLRRLAQLYPTTQWSQLLVSAMHILVRSAAHGFSPDWVLYEEKKGFVPDTDKKAQGSYDAIRVYLWAGMLAETDPARASLLRHFDPMRQYATENGAPPLTVDIATGRGNGAGPIGFSAALLPMLAVSHQQNSLEQQRRRVVDAQPHARSDNYYDQVLSLFGMGWLENRYRFDGTGKLLPQWSCRSS